jgi:ankyrin repeat protein
MADALTDLLTAAEHGDLAALDAALARRPDIDGMLPLQLQSQPGTNALGLHGGRCALHLALENNHRAIVDRLLSAGANPDTLGENNTFVTGEAALHVAARRGDAELVRILLAAGANPHLKQHDRTSVPGRAALQLAASRGHLAVAKLLLADPHPAAKAAASAALHAAAESGQLTMTRFLLEHGPNVNKSTDSCTPLMMACFGGFAPLVELLLEAGADLHKSGRKGMTPAYMVVHGARMAPENNRGCECPRDHKAVAELLVKRKANLNEPSYDGRSPLDWARAFADVPLVKPVLAVLERANG